MYVRPEDLASAHQSDLLEGACRDRLGVRRAEDERRRRRAARRRTDDLT